MVDTEEIADLRETVRAGKYCGWREQVKITFVGGVTLDYIIKKKMLWNSL